MQLAHILMIDTYRRGRPVRLRFTIDEKLSLPIHVQLKEQLKSLIQQGLYQPNDQLPSVRELAGFLRINRNTVQKAYTELEQDGFVGSRCGIGMFVAPDAADKFHAMQDELLNQTILALDAQGINISEFAFALLARHQVRCAERGMRPVLLFVECTPSQAAELASELATETGYVVKPCVLRDLSAQEASFRSGDYDLIVTTFLHVEEVEEYLGQLALEKRLPVAACLLESNILAMKRLQGLPKGSRVGIACATWEGTGNIRKSIIQSGLDHVELVEGAGEAPETLPFLLSQTACIVCSSYVAPLIQAFSPTMPVIIDDQTLTKQSIRLISHMMEGGART
ncbi:GntR family transcriptional regulator [Brevibacillus fluminis]|uniref:GntR family transcriptional regulator n=1 Tax=Brevibacillus fluminis TaxID=511487 RepID=A0A3M8CV48_9BACL|nr:GntR family transcriptional regulator [Brevibacillus fluminis]